MLRTLALLRNKLLFKELLLANEPLSVPELLARLR